MGLLRRGHRETFNSLEGPHRRRHAGSRFRSDNNVEWNSFARRELARVLRLPGWLRTAMENRGHASARWRALYVARHPRLSRHCELDCRLKVTNLYQRHYGRAVATADRRPRFD